MEGLFLSLTQVELDRIYRTVASHGHSPDSQGVRAFLLSQPEARPGKAHEEALLQGVASIGPLGEIISNLVRTRL